MIRRILSVLLLALCAGVAVAQETTLSPVIGFSENDNYLEVRIYCPEEAVLYVNGENVGLVSDEYVYQVERTHEEQTIMVTAYAQADGKLPSPEVTNVFTLSPLIATTEAPCITFEQDVNTGAGYVTITNYFTDPEAVIFYSVKFNDDSQSEWRMYNGDPLVFDVIGVYNLYAYALSPGKEPSPVAVISFAIDQYLPKRVIPPYIHPMNSTHGNGLRLKLIPDPIYVDLSYGYMPLPYSLINADAYYYSINGGELVSTGPQGAVITLQEYGQYTIDAYGTSQEGLDSQHVTAIINYDANGYTTLCDNTITHDDITYVINDGSQTLSVASDGSATRPSFNLNYSGDITIPATISIGGYEYTVTDIQDYAFSNHDYGITAVHLPSTISHIGEAPFAYCSQIMALSVDENNPYYDSRNNCNAIIETATNKLIAGCDNTVIPATVEAIGDMAFSNCQALAYINIPSSVTSIGSSAFYNCSGLKYIICHGATPPSAIDPFGEPYMINPEVALYVPADAEEAYRSHQFWTMFPNFNLTTHYTPLVLFDESDDGLMVYIFIEDPNIASELIIDGRSVGMNGDALSYWIPRRSSDDFHVLVYFIYGNSAYYIGYDSRYSSFATLPVLYASEVEPGKGLKINVCADANDYYTVFFWTDGFEHVWPESCDYRINGSGEWTRIDIDSAFYLPEYGDYTIEAYGVAGGDDCSNSRTITVDIHYGPDGFYSRCRSYIVYNGLYYFPENGFEYENARNVTAFLSQNYADGDPFTVPTPADIVIPASFIIAGDEYTVTQVDRHNCNDANSITCLSATPITAHFNYGEDAPFFEQVTLFVPQEGLEAYKADPEWGLFKRIVPFIGAGPGDVDGDGTIGIDDVTGLIDMLLSGTLPATADVDGNGIANIDDVTLLIDKLLGN